MALNLHLFSSPGQRDISYIVDAARPYLENRDRPLVACLPMASLSETSAAYTERAFKGLAQVVTLNTETMPFPQLEDGLRRAHVLFIPGGNTFLLAHRLHVSKLLPYLHKKLQAGLPLVAYSAGAVLCGPNVLTSGDLNAIPTPHFAGLNLIPFNIHAHYIDDPERDEWLSDYHVFQPNPIILLEDGACLRVENKKITLARGPAWLLRANREKEPLLPAQEIKLT